MKLANLGMRYNNYFIHMSNDVFVTKGVMTPSIKFKLDEVVNDELLVSLWDTCINLKRCKEWIR